MNDKAMTIYTSPDNQFSIDGIKVPGGILYVTSHHAWKVMNTVFVKDQPVITGGYDTGKHVNPEYVKEFLEGRR